MKKKIWLPAAFALLASCSSPSSIKNASIISPHLNLEQVADSQIVYLSQLNPDVQKNVVSNGQSETKSLKISDWNKELDILKKSNLDKPAFIGNYSIDISQVPGSTLKKFTAVKSDLIIKHQVVQLDSLGNLVHLESSSEDKNILYYTRKEISADFSVVKGKSILKNYSASAIQKIIGLDTFRLGVNAKIN
jgi:hypothetical protein